LRYILCECNTPGVRARTVRENELAFSVDSQLLGELGERLVTRNYIALAELVKNSYDADATTIEVSFRGGRKGKDDLAESEITLSDDGHGMSFQQVRDYWMRIATPYKIREPVSPFFGRRKTGNKGLGRFACRRLGRKLVLDSRARVTGTEELEWTQVIFDWAKFEAGTDLTEIPCQYTTRRIGNGEPGLTLTIKELIDGWTDAEFNLLRRQILSLSVARGVKRTGFAEDPGFEVRFDAPGFEKGVGFLADQFRDAGWGTLEGAVDEDGTVGLRLTAKELGVEEYRLPKRFDMLGGIRFEISYIPMKDKGHWRDTSTLTKGLTRELMLEQAGVRVYLDGFRVYPYGDPGDDWLSIDKDIARRFGSADRIFEQVASKLGVGLTRAMLVHPRNNNLVGRVHLTSTENMPFEVKLDREGLVWNSACDQLVEAVRLSLQWMVLHYNKYLVVIGRRAIIEAEQDFRGLTRDEGSTGEVATEQDSSVPTAIRALDLIADEAKRSHVVLRGDDKERADSRIESARQIVHLSFDRTQTYLAILRGVASTGALMLNFSHEVKNLISQLDTHANTLDRISSDLPRALRDEFNSFADSLRVTRTRLEQQINMFGALAQKTADTDRRTILVRPLCIQVAQGFRYLTEHYGMDEIEVDVPDSLKAGPMLEVELFSIAVNLVSNAVKANLAGQGKRVRIEGVRKGARTILRVLDDGIGLRKENREEVFKPLTSDVEGRLYKPLSDRIADPDLAALGRGSGLGLDIVRSIAEAYGGSALFVDAEEPWVTCVEVTIP